MRRVATPSALLIAAALVIGVLQARHGDDATKTEHVAALSRADVSRPIAGVPPQLAALRRRVNARVSGSTQALQAQLRALRGHPVVLNMWASWCHPCRYELPFLQRQALARARRVAFIGVNVNDGRARADAMAVRYPMPYPSFADPDEKIIHSYGGIGVPVTVFYDAAGRRQMVHQGVFATEQLLSDAIDRYALHRTG